MSPTSLFHFMADKNLTNIIENSLDSTQFFLTQDVGLIPSKGDVVYPDLAVYQKPIEHTESGLITSVPVFVAEILSPSTRKKDMTVKKELYARIGVPEYWIVSPRDKAVEVYKLHYSNYRLDNIYTLIPPEEWMQMTAEEKDEHPHLTLVESIDVSVDIGDIFKERN